MGTFRSFGPESAMGDSSGASIPAKSGGLLYVVATPIGNLADFSQRGREALAGSDLILCEDTRHTRKLLDHYDIRRPTESYHDFSEAEKAPRLVERLVAGATMALVSDAGTPTVSDPGYRLVRLARQAGLRVVPIPGPVAAMAALSVSGLPTDEFLFVGFLPPRQEARRRRLEGLAGQRATLILYEAPQRVRQTLTDILETLGDREAFVGREITKLHEECRLGPVSSLVDQVTARGEVVIVVAGADPSPEKLAGVDLEGMSRQDIVKLAARSLGVRRNELYARLFRKDGSDSE